MPNERKKDILSFIEYAQRRIHKPDEINRIYVPGHGLAAGPSCYFLYRSNYDLVYALLDFYYSATTGSATVRITDSNKPLFGGGKSIDVVIPAGMHIHTELLINEQEQIYIENTEYPVSNDVIVTIRAIRYNRSIFG